jgi:hypothetical protein
MAPGHARAAKSLLAAWAALSWALPARAESSVELQGVDVYRSAELTPEKVEAAAGHLIKSYVRLRATPGQRMAKRLQLVKAEIEKKLRGLGSFAYLGLSYGDYYTSAKHTSYLTVDVVDAADAASRMPFPPPPQGHPTDPEGLLDAWKKFNALGTSLSMKGELSLDRPDCPAFFCLWGSQTPELAAFEKRFVQGVPPNKKLLKATVQQEADPQKRAAALYLLSYLPDGRQVAEIMTEALLDPDETVRGAALQVLSDVAVYHKDVLVDAAKIIPVIDYPTVSDRSKALAVLVGMQENAIYRPLMLQKAGPYLVGLLKEQQPSVHDLAFTLLGLLSKESYDRRDYASWQRWVDAQKATFTR